VNKSEGTVAVFVLFEIVHVLELFVSLVCDATNILPDAVADALFTGLTLASSAWAAVLLVRAIAIVGHGLSFSVQVQTGRRSKAGATVTGL
jgi:hypothetical protein